MRLRHSFNGFKIIKGTIIFHLSFFIASFAGVIDLPTDKMTHVEFDFSSGLYKKDPILLLAWVRLHHLFILGLILGETILEYFG